MGVLRYAQGSEVRLGDRVRFRGTMASVVLISDGEGGEFSPGYRDHLGCDPGILLADDDGETTFITEPGFDLELVSAAGAKSGAN
jgi:hypothetical protein